MSDPVSPPPPPPTSSGNLTQPRPNRALGWFFAVSGAVVLLLTLGCIFAISDGNGWRARRRLRLADACPGRGFSLAGLAPPKALSSR
jgi:hypothetical protein